MFIYTKYMRHRACGIVLKDDAMLLMLRKNPQNEEYYTIPGGGIEEGETVNEAVVREMFEECSLVVKPMKELFVIAREGVDMHHHILCNRISGEPAIHQDSPEYKDNLEGNNLHIPQWIPISDLKNLTLYPTPAKEKLIEYLDSTN